MKGYIAILAEMKMDAFRNKKSAATQEDFNNYSKLCNKIQEIADLINDNNL